MAGNGTRQSSEAWTAGSRSWVSAMILNACSSQCPSIITALRRLVRCAFNSCWLSCITHTTDYYYHYGTKDNITSSGYWIILSIVELSSVTICIITRDAEFVFFCGTLTPGLENLGLWTAIPAPKKPGF